MCKKIQLLVLLLLLCGQVSFSQEFEYGKVTKGELEEKFHPSDTSAPAAILYKKGKTYFTLDMSGYWSMITEVECRIKIYKKNGFKYANEELTYYTGGKIIKAKFSNACTYNLAAGNIEKTKLGKDGEFEVKVNEEFEQKKIMMPNVREGSVIEYKYRVATPYFTAFPDWYFQYDIPANYVVYEVAIPGYFTYNTYLTNPEIIQQSKPVYRNALGYNFKESVVVYSARNVKPLKNEKYVNNINNYIASIKFELASTHFRSGIEHYSTNWEAVAKKIYEHEDFGRQLEMNSYFKEDLNALITTSSTDNEKAMAVFNYVRSRMNWNGDTDYYCEKGVKKAYESKVGNSAEINLILVAMLREIGIDANPVLVSTRSNGVAVYPTRSAFNYVIASALIDNETVLLDATSKYTTKNILPMRVLNWEGRVIKKDGTNAEIDLMPQKNSKSMATLIASLSPDGLISGKIRRMYSDYHAYTFREQHAGISEDANPEAIENDYKGIEVTDYHVADESDMDKPVIEEFSFTHSGISEKIGDKIYISPLLLFTEKENPFKEETREYPIDFLFPYQYRYIVNITLPEGYAIESMPSAVIVRMEQEIGMFKYNIGTTDGAVQVGVSIDINYPIISEDYYHTLKDFFQKMVEKESEKIVLKRI